MVPRKCNTSHSSTFATGRVPLHLTLAKLSVTRRPNQSEKPCNVRGELIIPTRWESTCIHICMTDTYACGVFEFMYERRRE